MQKFLIAILLMICFQSIRAQTLSVMEKAKVFLEATMVDSLSFQEINLPHKKKGCVLTMRSDSVFMIPDTAIKYAQQWSMGVSDYVVCDRLKQYKGMDAVFTSETGHTFMVNFNFPNTRKIKRIRNKKLEIHTLEEKIDMLFNVSSYVNSYRKDTATKTLFFQRIVTPDWLNNPLMLKESTDRYAKFVYAYVLRNRHDKFETIVFDFWTNTPGVQGVHLVYTKDAPIFKGLE